MNTLKEAVRTADVRDWLFWEDTLPNVLRCRSDSIYALSYMPKAVGPAVGMLKPFNILHIVEFEHSEYVLGSAMGFEAGDARFFFAGEKVDIVKRRFAIEMTESGPVYWETQLFSNNGVVVSMQKFNPLFEIYRVTEVFNLSDPSVLIAASAFSEKRHCAFCVARGDICECPITIKKRTFGLECNRFDNVITDKSMNAWNKFRTLLTTSCDLVSLWEFVIQFRIGDVLTTVSTNQWTVEYNYLVAGEKLDSMKTSFIQAKIMSNADLFSGGALQKRSSSHASTITRGESSILEKSELVQGKNAPRLKSPSVCPYCDASFGRVYELERHCRSVHLQERKFECEQCSKKFTQKGHLTKHINAVHENIRQFPCPLCDLKFRTKCKTRRHYNAVHLNFRPNVCKECGSAFQQNSDVKRHVLAKHPHIADKLLNETKRPPVGLVVK